MNTVKMKVDEFVEAINSLTEIQKDKNSKRWYDWYTVEKYMKIVSIATKYVATTLDLESNEKLENWGYKSKPIIIYQSGYIQIYEQYKYQFIYSDKYMKILSLDWWCGELEKFCKKACEISGCDIPDDIINITECLRRRFQIYLKLEKISTEFSKIRDLVYEFEQASHASSPFSIYTIPIEATGSTYDKVVVYNGNIRFYYRDKEEEDIWVYPWRAIHAPISEQLLTDAAINELEQLPERILSDTIIWARNVVQNRW